MTTIIKFIVGLLVALLFTSCNFDMSFGQLRGNGNVITEDMNISQDFIEVSTGNGWEVILEKGDRNAVIIEADENLVDAAEVYLQNGNLKIYCEKGIRSAASKKVYVTHAKSLTGIHVGSGASITTKETLRGTKLAFDASSGGVIKLEVAAREVETEASSGAVIRLSGSTDQLTSSGSSGSVTKIKDLKSIRAKAKASSGAVIQINVSQDLKANASSGGVIHYYGDPKKVDKPKKNYSGGVIQSKG